MSRPLSPVKTALGQHLRARRGSRSGRDVAKELGMLYPTYFRLEHGARAPSVDSAIILARYLGWSLEEVIAAARRPPVDDPQS